MKKLLCLAALFLLLAGWLRLPPPVKAGPATICTWTGGSPGDDYWETADNWSCGHAPTSSDDVVVGTIGSKAPHVQTNESAGMLTLSGPLFVDNSSTLTLVSWQTLGGAVIHTGPGFMTGPGTIGLGTTGISGQFTGDITVLSGGTLKLEASPGAYIYASGNLSVNLGGTLNATDVDGAVYMLGATLTNNGLISLPDVYFEKGSPATQHIAGGGSWSGTTLYVSDGTRLVVDNDMTLDTLLFSMGGSLPADILAVGAHNVTFSGGELSVGSDAQVTGSGTVHTINDVKISAASANKFDPRLTIDNGTSHVSGTFNGAITVASGAILSSIDSITANNDLTVLGTLAGDDSGSSFSLVGAHCVNNGLVKVGDFYFYDPPALQHLSGTGTWGAPTTLWVENSDTTQELDLESDINFKGYELHLGKLNLNGHIFKLTGPSQVYFDSYGQIIGTGTLQTQGSVTINGYPAVTPALSVLSGTTTLVGGGYSGPVTVASGATLAVDPDGSVNLSNNVTLNGTLASAGELTFDGTAKQTVTGTGTAQFHVLDIENSAGVSLAVPATLDDILTLNGDINPAQSLTLAITATTGGTGEVYGTILRTGAFVKDQPYSFGNPALKMTFTSGTTLPTRVTLYYPLAQAPGLARSILGWYSFTAVGGSAYACTLDLHYAQANLNGVDENLLQLFNRVGSGTWHAITPGSFDTYWNIVELTNLTAFSDWALAGKAVLYLPLVKR